MQSSRKDHWESIYERKGTKEVSWFQESPKISLELMKSFKLAKSAGIIDIGGGDSFFVDHLLELGFSDITVLDISEKAIARAKRRLGEKAERVDWIICNVSEFKPTRSYDLWHDRAAFHFLITEAEVNNYIKIISQTIRPGGYFILGTFSENGPEKCSGLPIRQYSEDKMKTLLGNEFERIRCLESEHHTPSGYIQNFIFCGFKHQ